MKTRDDWLREIEESKAAIARQHKEWQDLYFQYLGRAVSEWAGLEIVLDANIHVIMQHYDGKSIEPRIPMALNAKIKFLRRAFEKLKPLVAWREQFMADIDQIEGLSEDRHQLIHGSSLQYLGDENGPLRGFMSMKMDFSKKTEHALANREITIPDINKFRDALPSLTNSQVAIGQAMRAPFPGGTLKDAQS